MKQNEWKHEFVPAVVNSPDNIEDAYAACAFQKKTLTKSQKAFFAAKWYYDDVKKLADEHKKLNDNGIAVTQKIHTSLTVAQRVGLNTPDHVAKAYQLLQFDSWFYEFTTHTRISWCKQSEAVDFFAALQNFFSHKGLRRKTYDV